MSKDFLHFSLHCNTCGKDVFIDKEDYFMLKDEVWSEVCSQPYVSHTYVLCKECTERFLGRKLRREDYQEDNPCNTFLY